MKTIFRKITAAMLVVFMMFGLSLTSFGQNVIINEEFTSCTEGEANGSASSKDALSLLPGWSGSSVFQAGGSIKMGSASKLGSVTTPELDFTGNAVLTFKSMAWSGDATTLKLSISSGSLEFQTVTISNAGYTFESFIVNITGVTAPCKITFEGYVASKSRFFLDDVKVVTDGVATPKLVVNPTSVNFGEIVNSTTSATKEISVSGENLTGNISYTKGGNDADAFTVTEGTWNAATGGKLNVVFNPTAEKDYTATITLNSTDATDVVVNLTGKGVSQLIPSIEVSSTALAFGNVVENQTKQMTFTVTPQNLSGDLTIVATGEGFTVSPATIAAATTTTQTVTVTFAPTAVKDYTGEITINGGGLESAKVVTVTGKGVVAPEPSSNLIVNGGFEDWTETAPQGWTNTTQAGTSYAKETAIKVSGDNSLKLMHTGTSGTGKFTATLVNVIAGQEYTFSMDYYMVSSKEESNGLRYWGTWKNGTTNIANTVAGWDNLQMGQEYLPAKPYGEWRKVELKVTAPEGATVLSMDLRWYAQVTCYVDNVSLTTNGATVPKLVVNPTSVDFGEVVNSTTSATKEITVSGSNLTGAISYTKGGNDADAFTVTEGTWNAATGGKLNVVFNPTAEKDYTATLTLKSTDATDVVVNLTGKGVNQLIPSIEVNATELAFNDVIENKTKSMTFTVTPKNLSGELRIDATGEGFTVSPATIAAATTTAQTVTVTFAPTAVKAYTGLVTINGGGIANAVNVTLSGNGIASPEPSQNLIVNGGFESWTEATIDDWNYTTQNGASYAKESTIKVSGDYSIKLIHTGSSGTANIAAKRVNVQAGTQYVFSMDYYAVSYNTATNNGVRYWGTWRDATGATVADTNLQPEGYFNEPLNQWNNTTVTVLAPEGAVSLDLQIRWYNQVTCYIDNVSLTLAGSIPTIDAPVAKEATAVSYNKFTANWDVVAEATSYLLTVSNDDGAIFTDKVVTGTSFEVLDLDPATEYSYFVKAKNDQATSVRSNIIIVATEPVGVNNLESNSKIFANGNVINIELTEDATVSVIDINGRVIAQAKGSAQITVNTTGVYIVKIATSKDAISKKLIIK